MAEIEHIKLLMLGDQGVGKTYFKIKTVDVDGLRTKLQIWDTAGQERFRNITVSYFKGAHGVVLVYDVAERATFNSISHWMEQIKKHADEQVNVILVGNKCDRESHRQVSREEGAALARSYNLPFLECSAKNNVNIGNLFETIARNTKNRLMLGEGPQKSRSALGSGPGNLRLPTDPQAKDAKSGCC